MELRDLQKELEGARSRLGDARAFLHIDEKTAELAALDERAAAPDFWNDAAAAQAVSKQASNLRATIADYERACGLADDAAAALELVGTRPSPRRPPRPLRPSPSFWTPWKWSRGFPASSTRAMPSSR